MKLFTVIDGSHLETEQQKRNEAELEFLREINVIHRMYN